MLSNHFIIIMQYLWIFKGHILYQTNQMVSKLDCCFTNDGEFTDLCDWTFVCLKFDPLSRNSQRKLHRSNCSTDCSNEHHLTRMRQRDRRKDHFVSINNSHDLKFARTKLDKFFYNLKYGKTLNNS